MGAAIARRRVITTWFYEQRAKEGGYYAQVRGPVDSERFRDVYRRCIALFFVTARRQNPEADLLLFTNRAWDANASTVAADVATMLEAIGVRTVLLDYSFAPPPTWPGAWRNQFFVFDIIGHLARATSDDDLVLVLDSDIVWSGAGDADLLWDRLASAGHITYEIDYPLDHGVNGVSRRTVGAIAAELGVGDPPAPYCGGEFIALTGETCGVVAGAALKLWPEILARHRAGLAVPTEEAHFLSLILHGLERREPSGDDFIKRLWTQAFKDNNVVAGDADLLLWHVPAEKRYGLRRLFARLQRLGTERWLEMAPDVHHELLRRQLGVPRNSLTKSILDVSSALAGRALHRT